MDKLLEKIQEKEFTTREFCLLGCILFLLGILIGVAVSPKGQKSVGCNNGCNCGNNNSGCLVDEVAEPAED